VARGAVFRSGLIEEDGFSDDNPRQLVAFRTAHVLMRATQREFGPLVVIKERWLPLVAVVTFNALRDTSLGELFPVNIFVAVLALGGSGFEVHIDQLRFQTWRLVAIDAGCHTVCAEQREPGLGVIESRQFLP